MRTKAILRGDNTFSRAGHLDQADLDSMNFSTFAALMTVFAVAMIILSSANAFAATKTQWPVALRTSSTAGNGCPANSATVFLNPDRSSVMVQNIDVVAIAGQRFASFDSDDNLGDCTVTLDLVAPPGMQYTLKGFESVGDIAIESGASAQMMVSYGFTGGRQGRSGLAFQGPLDLTARLNRDFTFLNQVWSSCALPSPLKVKVQLTAKSDWSGTRGSYVALLADQANVLKLNLDMRACEE